MQRDTRQLLRTGLAIFLTGAVAALLALTVFGGITRQGPHTDAGWLAALIVATVYGAIAAVLALSGKSKVKAATPPMPEQTVQSVKADVESTKQHAKEGRQ